MYYRNWKESCAKDSFAADIRIASRNCMKKLAIVIMWRHFRILKEIYGDHIVIATGRRGADWLEKICAKYDIAHKPGTVDIGVCVEVRNEIMEEVNNVLYESKLIGYPKPFKNKVRTFYQNPGGFVSQENYDNDLAVVNGHSYKEKKSANTNLAILCSHNFTEPFNQTIAYAQKVGELTNMLGSGIFWYSAMGITWMENAPGRKN